MSSIARSQLVSPPSFGDRTALLADCERQLAHAGVSKRIIILELAGVSQPSDISRAAFERRLAEADGAHGSCYRLRGGEYCLLVDEADADRMVEGLDLDTGGDGLVGAWGYATLPVETTDPALALELADRRLQLQKREKGIEPKPLLGQPRLSAGGGAMGTLFRNYDNVTKAYEPAAESELKLGDLVIHCGSQVRIRGVSPMSLPDRTAELEDLVTGKRSVVPFDELRAGDSTDRLEA